MEREEILSKAVEDNKGLDIADLEAQKTASMFGYYIVATLILVVTLVDKVVLDKTNFGALMACFMMFSIAFLVKYIKLKRRHELIVSILYGLVAVASLVCWIMDLVKVW
jgi:UDP-N-acetylmuramyl pentapeptide phosphotransferase/UDP-N-acetylglucosamine-1-phosphate transferase